MKIVRFPNVKTEFDELLDEVKKLLDKFYCNNYNHSIRTEINIVTVDVTE